MFQTLGLFRTADAMARHAGAQTAIVARNIANADTPGYRATTLPPFAESHAAASTATLRTTRPGHSAGSDGATATRVRLERGEAAPNGNDVSLEEEMLRAADAEREHSRALAIYRHGLTVLRTVLGG